MAKVSGAWASVVRGVSQQAPEQRQDGQHHEQVNMLSDPIAGLSRRRGSVMEMELSLGASLSAPALAATTADHRACRVKDMTIGLNRYSLLYRHEAKPTNSIFNGLYCYDKTNNASVPVVTAGGDTSIATMLASGFNTVGQVGRFALLAIKGFNAQGTSSDLYGVTANTRYGSVWIRSGAYARTFEVTVKLAAGSPVTVSYTTPKSTYQGTLDTSDILTSDPDYTKKVNDRVNAYNSAVTAYLGTAAAAIQPQAIAEQLRLLLVAAGVTWVTRQEAHLLFDNATLASVRATDSGDDTMVRVAYQEITTSTDVTARHYVGKIVQVKPTDGGESYYLVARPQTEGGTGFTAVRWEEGTATSFTPGLWFAIGTVEAGTFYVASTPALLASLAGITVPSIESRVVGDAESNKAPYFIGREVTMIASFQDRLVIGSGPVLSMSKIGDYFNFFRTSVLTVLDDDPVEVYALGGEDDKLLYASIYDKSLFAFGEQRQYSISGRVPVTPRTTSVQATSAYLGTEYAAPAVTGDLVFFSQHSEGYTKLYQMQTGNLDDTTVATDVTLQLDTYMPGEPIEILASTNPSMAFVRTNSDQNDIYTFRYIDIDRGTKRVLDSWSRWEFATELGNLMGMSLDAGGLLLFWSRTATDASGTPRLYLVADRIALLSGESGKPLLDSLRPYAAVVAGASTRPVHSTSPNVATAYDNTVYTYLLGEPTLADVPSLIAEFPSVSTGALWSGYNYDSYYVPTNPRMKDRKDVAIVNGRLTVTRVDLSYRNTAGVIVDVEAFGETTRALDFNGRVLGAINNKLDEQPVSAGSVPVFIGREVREYTMTVRAKLWLPLGVNGMEWTGQFFYGARRA